MSEEESETHSEECDVDDDDPSRPENNENIFEYLQSRWVYKYPEDGSHRRWIAPQAMVIFEKSDLRFIARLIVKALLHPISMGQLASVIVHEPVREELIFRIRNYMEPMDERILVHPNFLHTVKMIDRMRCETIYIEEFDKRDRIKRYARQKIDSPIVVCDFPQLYFGTKPSGIITLNTFRTFNEAIKLYNREGLEFQTVSIWSPKLTHGFELATRMLKTTFFSFNCYDVNYLLMKPFFDKQENTVMIKNGYHFEVIMINGMQKIIAFPTLS